LDAGNRMTGIIKNLKISNMQPINKNERRSAFWNFLLLFVICFAIILTMVFFSVRVPFDENEKLHQKMAVIDKEREFSDKFTKKMIGVSRLLDSLDRVTPQESEILEGKIGQEISALNSMVADTTFNKDLYLNVVHNLGDMQQYSKKVRNETDKDMDVNNYKSQLQKANEKAQEYYTKYIECLTKK
jgi:Type VI secretion system, TssO